MVEVENHFTVFIRLPFNRGDFIDPPPVAWSAAKERALWDVISRQGQGKGNEIDWYHLADEFEVTQPFLLQQAAWLYERQLSQVRAQMRKVGNRASATPSPAPGSMTASMMGGQAMKRGGSGGSRVPSRLSTHPVGSPTLGTEGSAPGTPIKSKSSFPMRNPYGAVAQQGRGPPGAARPISRQSSKEVEPTVHSRRSSLQQQPVKSPVQRPPPQVRDSDSEEDTQANMAARRQNPASIHRRAASLRKDQLPQRTSQAQVSDGEDDDDSPSFLPFAPNPSEPTPTSQQDPSATIRGGFVQTTPQRPIINRRPTSERIVSPIHTASPATTPQQQQLPFRNQSRPLTSSTSSLSSNPPTATTHVARPSTTSATAPKPTTVPSRPSTAPLNNPLSPTQQAALAGLSPRIRHSHRYTTSNNQNSPNSNPNRNGGSDTSPSMGSSFSDLDDASVTQSALEEALMSGMGNTTSTMGGGTMGVTSRVSGIGQALRSRYFDTRGAGAGQGYGHGQGGGQTDR